MEKLKYVVIGSLIFLSACATKPDYEICDTPNCGDNVSIIISD